MNFKDIACQDFVEIHKNLWLGSKMTILNLITKNEIDVLVPLDDLTSDIWKYGYTGEIEYCPIEDFGVLPKNIEKIIVDKIVNYIKNDKSVAVFCSGGKGRTGYIASLVLKELNCISHENGVIGHLRDVYNKEAVESYKQISRAAESELVEYWKKESYENQWIYNCIIKK